MRAPRIWGCLTVAGLFLAVFATMLVVARPKRISEHEAVQAARESARSNVNLPRPLEDFRVQATWRASEAIWRVDFTDASTGYISVDVPADHPHGWTSIRSSYPMGK